ncbi:response regulator [Elusimicrobiota bacterium]
MAGKSMDSINILVIDDYAEICRTIKETLVRRNAQLRIDAAYSGQEGLEKFSKKEFDLVLLDYVLPEENGLEVLSRIREKDPSVAVIFMTGCGEESVAVEAINRGANTFISKGEDFSRVLPSVVERVLGDRIPVKQYANVYAMFEKSLGTFFKLDDMLPLILNVAGAMLKADNGSIMLFDNEKNELVVKAAFGDGADKIRNIKLKKGERIAGLVADKGESRLLLNGLEGYPEFKHLSGRKGVRSALCIPLKAGGEVLGIINVNNMMTSKEQFAEHSLELLTSFAQRAALAIQNALIHEKLLSTQVQLIQSEKMAAIGKIAAWVAHQLNSPLAGIGQSMDVLKRRTDKDDPSYKLVVSSKEAVTFCAKVIKDLLQFSRTSPDSDGEVDCNKAIEGILSFATHQLEARKVKVVKKLDSGISMISGNANQLQQVFLNMIANAGDSMSDGGTLTISTSVKKEKGRSGVEIVFADTGSGIKDDDMDKIFNPFFTTKKGTGTGMGLYVSREIVTNHSGVISVKSVPGKGSVFTILIPVGGKNG